MDWLNIDERAQIMNIAPVEEIPYSPAIGLTGVLVSDGGGEEFNEPLPGGLAGLDDETRRRDRHAPDLDVIFRGYDDVVCHAI